MESEILVLVDSERRVVGASRPGRLRSVEESVGLTCCEAFGFCEADSTSCPLLAALGEEARKASATVRREGRFLALTSFPLPSSPEGARAALVARDETLRREIESGVNQSARLAAIGEMAAGVAHELNSPLTAVIGNANLLLRRADEGDRSLPLLTDIKSAGQRAKRIIESLLTFARRDNFRLEPVSVNEVAASALNLLSFQLDKEGVRVTTDLNPGLPQVMGNGQQLEQVIVNLLLNARDAVRGRADREVRLLTDYCAAEDGRFGVSVAVADNGPGIGEERIERVFHPFFTTKEGEKGTGLGLSVSLGIAKAHGGTLTVESRPGRGATFTLELPLLPDRLVLDPGSSGEGAGPAGFLNRIRPRLMLARNLALLCSRLTKAPPAAVTVCCRGSTEGWGVGLVTAAFLEGLLCPGEPVGSTLAACRAIARERGVAVAESGAGAGEEYRFSIEARVSGETGTVECAGALLGRNEARLVMLEGFSVETPLSGNLLFLWAADRPGLVGSIASALAERGISMLQMRSSEANGAGVSLATFHLDNPADGPLLDQLSALDGIRRVEAVNL